MKTIKSKNFRIQQRNQHLRNILDESYYIELGTVSPMIMERICKGETVQLIELVHNEIAKEGTGQITFQNENELDYQFAFLNSLRNKTSTNKICLTCGVLHYRLNDFNEYYAPLVIIPVEIDFENHDLRISNNISLNTILINEIQANLGIDIKHDAKELSYYQIDSYCREVAKKTGFEYSVGNYLTVVSVEYTENSLDFDGFSTQRSIYEKPGVEVLRDFFTNFKPVTPTNIYQKSALLKINNGESFLIDGPLGTGKTHTIINAIANAIFKHKKVLYVSQDTTHVSEVEKLLKQVFLTPFAYNLCRNYVYNDDEETIVPNIREEKIGIETITPISEYEQALYSSIHGCTYSEIITSLAIIKNLHPEIEKIPIEVNLEKYEINDIYQSLKEIEKILEIIEPLDINVWSKIEQYYTKSHVQEIIDSTNNYAASIKALNKKIKDFCKKYFIKMPSNFINVQKLLSCIATFKKLTPPAEWVKKYNPEKINELLKVINGFQSADNKLNEVYSSLLINNYKQGKVSDLFNVILYKHLNYNNEEYLKNILNNSVSLATLLDEISKDQTEFNKNLEALESLIDYSTNDESLYNYIKSIYEFTCNGYFRKEWLTHYVSSNYALEEIEELKELINKFITLKDLHSKYLLKDEFISYHNIKELSENRNFVNLVISKFDRKQLRREKVSTDECYKNVLDLLAVGEKIKAKASIFNIPMDNIDDFVIGYSKYITFVSSLNKNAVKIFKHHIKISANSLVHSEKLQHLCKQFVSLEKNLLTNYESLKEFGIEINGELIFNKNQYSIEWLDYIKRTINARNEIVKLFKGVCPTIDDVLTIINSDKEHNNLKENLDMCYDEMNTYLGTTYKGLKTDCLLLSVLEKNYGSFIDSLENKKYIETLFKDKLIYEMIGEYDELLSLVENFQRDHNLFSRYFIGGQSRFLELELEKARALIRKYEERTKEVSHIFKIFDHVRRFEKLGLKQLCDGILQSKYSVGISEMYIYSTYLDYQNELINKYPVLSESYNIPIWLENYNYFERNCCISTIKSLQRMRFDDKRIMSRIHNIPFNEYQRIIDELINHKNVFLMDLNIFNIINDFSKFDLILVDDVNLSSAIKYNKINGCNQVVLFGDSSVLLGNANSIFGQIPKKQIFSYTESYLKDNPNYGNKTTVNNYYILDYKRNQYIKRYESLDSIVNAIVGRFYQNSLKKINIIVCTNNYKLKLYRGLVAKLRELNNDLDVFKIFDENIKIVKAPNEMADYANEVYFMFDDIDDQHVKDMKRLVKQYSRVSDAVYFCAVDFETETNLDFTKYINSIIKENYSDEITKPQLVEIIKNELLERGIQAENGFGRLEIIIKGKSAKGKKTIPNIGIMLEGMNNRVPYSILNDYQYYMNEYTKNGWKIFVFYVDDIISKLQLRLNEVSSYLASKDQNVTHQLKIDEFID